jgi:hypothetical protein
MHRNVQYEDDGHIIVVIIVAVVIKMAIARHSI